MYMPRDRHTLLIITFFLVIAMISGCNFPPYQHWLAQRTETDQVDPSEFVVGEQFYALYNSLPDSQRVFGQPISQPFIDPVNGHLSQYFTNMRLEYYRNQAGEENYFLSPLGRFLFEPEEHEYLVIDKNCVTLDDSLIPICNEIRTFYEQNNGVQIFGVPISHVFTHNNRYYQYFENASLVWDPMKPADRSVSLVNLGEQYLAGHEPLRYTITSPTNPATLNIDRQVTDSEFYVSISMEHIYLNPSSSQTITILATDHAGHAVSNAWVTVWIMVPDESYQAYRPADTNEYGITSLTLPPFDASSVQFNDIVQIQVEIQKGEDYGVGRSSFRIWR
jgi:hypothetical protein